jgi:hypothetical protein
MAEAIDIGEDQLALLLQLARDFAFKQLADNADLVPFATRIPPEGEVDFVRFADEADEVPIEDIYHRTQLVLAEEARLGEVLAAAMVANVRIAQPGSDAEFPLAVQVHVEAPGYSRMVFAPYRVEQSAGDGQKRFVKGAMMVSEVPAAIFAG